VAASVTATDVHVFQSVQSSRENDGRAVLDSASAMLFDRIGWERKAQHAIDTALAGDFAAAEAMLAPLAAGQRASAWTSVAEALAEKGRKEGGRVEDALGPLRSLIARADRDRRSRFGTDIPRDVLADAESLHDGLIAELRGAEQVVVEHAVRGNLAVRSGHNHALLAKSKMV